MSQPVSVEPIMQIATGFWASKALMAGVDLDVFTKITGKSVSFEELCSTLKIAPRPAEALASALCSLGFLQGKETGGKKTYSNSLMSETFLVTGKPNFIGGIVKLFDKTLYAEWNKVVEAIVQNRPVDVAAASSGESLFDSAKASPAVMDVVQMFTDATRGISL